MTGIKSRGENIFSVFNYAIMIVICVITLYPLWHIAMASFSDPIMVLARRGFFIWPIGNLSFKGYQLVIENPNISTGFLNTAFYVSVGTILCMLVTILGAFVLSRKGLFWSRPIMLMIIFTLYFHGGLIPFYIMVMNMGMLESRWSIVLPLMVNTWNFIILRTSFAGVPDSLIESARIDGASELRVIWQIVIPVCRATVSVITLFYAVRFWNEWFYPSLFLTNRTLWPIQLVLRDILIRNDTSMMTQVSSIGQTGQEAYRLLVKYCTIIVATVPILVTYPFVQKYFVSGIMIGSLKG
jgi:putative aldouronate transport system permease protein